MRTVFWFSVLLIFFSAFANPVLARGLAGVQTDNDPGAAPETIEALTERADRGEADALAELGYAYLIGQEVEADPEYARALIEIAAESHEPYTLNMLAIFYSLAGGEADEAKILPLLEEASEAGFLAASFNLGTRYYYGQEGAEVDYGKARAYLDQAATDETLYPLASYYLGLMAYYGYGEDKNPAKGFALIKSAAVGGYDVAQFETARFYENDWGIERDPGKAFEWYLAAAENGHGQAQWNVGMAYVRGEAVEADPVKAVEWFQKSADTGNDNGMTSLAVMYATGEGVAQDFKKAFELYQQAAEKGNSQAIKNMAGMYWRGEYVAENAYFGAVLFEAAVYLGNSDAISFIESYREINSEETVEKVKADARQWLSERGIPFDGDETE